MTCCSSLRASPPAVVCLLPARSRPEPLFRCWWCCPTKTVGQSSVASGWGPDAAGRVVRQLVWRRRGPQTAALRAPPPHAGSDRTWKSTVQRIATLIRPATSGAADRPNWPHASSPPCPSPRGRPPSSVRCGEGSARGGGSEAPTTPPPCVRPVCVDAPRSSPRPPPPPPPARRDPVCRPPPQRESLPAARTRPWLPVVVACGCARRRERDATRLRSVPSPSRSPPRPSPSPPSVSFPPPPSRGRLACGRRCRGARSPSISLPRGGRRSRAPASGDRQACVPVGSPGTTPRLPALLPLHPPTPSHLPARHTCSGFVGSLRDQPRSVPLPRPCPSVLCPPLGCAPARGAPPRGRHAGRLAHRTVPA